MFVPVTLDISAAQLRALGQGQFVHLKREQIGVGRVFFVKKPLFNRIQKWQSKGKGLKFKVDEATMQHNMKRGAGFFGSVASLVAPAIVSAALPTIIRKATGGGLYVGGPRGGRLSQETGASSMVPYQMRQFEPEQMHGDTAVRSKKKAGMWTRAKRFAKKHGMTMLQLAAAAAGAYGKYKLSQAQKEAYARKPEHEKILDRATYRPFDAKSELDALD